MLTVLYMNLTKNVNQTEMLKRIIEKYRLEIVLFVFYTIVTFTFVKVFLIR